MQFFLEHLSCLTSHRNLRFMSFMNAKISVAVGAPDPVRCKLNAVFAVPAVLRCAGDKPLDLQGL